MINFESFVRVHVEMQVFLLSDTKEIALHKLLLWLEKILNVRQDLISRRSWWAEAYENDWLKKGSIGHLLQQVGIIYFESYDLHTVCRYIFVKLTFYSWSLLLSLKMSSWRKFCHSELFFSRDSNRSCLVTCFLCVLQEVNFL